VRELVGISEALWNEKHRPRSLQGVLGQEGPVATLKAFVRKGCMPHLLLLGPPGAAKTTSALCLIGDLYGDEVGAHFLELDPSQRDTLATIKEFASSRPVSGVHAFKIALLPQLESMSPAAQQSLRRVMEWAAANCRLIFTAQRKDSVIGPIRSRCSILLFQPYPAKEVQSHLAKMLDSEGVKYDAPGLRRITDYADGDLRIAIDLAQAVSAVKGKISAIAVYQVTEGLYPQDVKGLFEQAISGDFEASRQMLRGLLVDPGYAGADIIRQLQREALGLDLDEGEKERLIAAAARADANIALGGEAEIQISPLLARLAALGERVGGTRVRRPSEEADE
jgi:replication factor C small subunit